MSRFSFYYETKCKLLESSFIYDIIELYLKEERSESKMFLFLTPSRDQKKVEKKQKNNDRIIEDLILFHYASNYNK